MKLLLAASSASAVHLSGVRSLLELGNAGDAPGLMFKCKDNNAAGQLGEAAGLYNSLDVNEEDNSPFAIHCEDEMKIDFTQCQKVCFEMRNYRGSEMVTNYPTCKSTDEDPAIASTKKFDSYGVVDADTNPGGAVDRCWDELKELVTRVNAEYTKSASIGYDHAEDLDSANICAAEVAAGAPLNTFCTNNLGIDAATCSQLCDAAIEQGDMHSAWSVKAGDWALSSACADVDGSVTAGVTAGDAQATACWEDAAQPALEELFKSMTVAVQNEDVKQAMYVPKCYRTERATELCPTDMNITADECQTACLATQSYAAAWRADTACQGMTNHNDAGMAATPACLAKLKAEIAEIAKANRALANEVAAEAKDHPKTAAKEAKKQAEIKEKQALKQAAKEKALADIAAEAAKLALDQAAAGYAAPEGDDDDDDDDDDDLRAKDIEDDDADLNGNDDIFG